MFSGCKLKKCSVVVRRSANASAKVANLREILTSLSLEKVKQKETSDYRTLKKEMYYDEAIRLHFELGYGEGSKVVSP